jgi:hypothetical protein
MDHIFRDNFVESSGSKRVSACFDRSIASKGVSMSPPLLRALLLCALTFSIRLEGPVQAGEDQLDDFERAPRDWKFVGGEEFPGAKGSLARDTGRSHVGGQAAGRELQCDRPLRQCAGPDGFTDDFHTYDVRVEEDFITFYFDGRELRKDVTPREKVPLYLMIDLALGGGWPIDTTQNPSHMMVDHVRAYAKK